LTEELVRQGHEVTLFASQDSHTRAELIAPCRSALRLSQCRDPIAYHILMLELVAQHASRFDVLHFHVDYLHFPLCRRRRWKQVTTLHGRLDMPVLAALYREFAEVAVVSISEAQRKPLPWLNWQGTVHHGLPLDLHTYRPQSGSYLAFLGRVSPEKGVDRAISIALRSGWKLRIAAKVDAADRDYFENRIRPLINRAGNQVEFLGEVGGKAKDEFLGNAHALLFPIDWPEPFGLVMIEALACGTPVIAFRRGSVPEVLSDDVTGLIVANVEEAVQAVSRVASLSRQVCRQVFEARFSAAQMTRAYLGIYRRLLARPTGKRKTPTFLRRVRNSTNGHARLPANRSDNVLGLLSWQHGGH
jgi:glycosyltransferase involved in cell wall biosynthesis